MRVATLLDQADLSSSVEAPELFLQTVPRTLVHRAAVSEVLVTGIQRIDADHFRVGAQWPRSHSYYGPVANRWHDPMLLAESIRQALLLISHQAYDVPIGYQFLSHTVAHDMTAEGALLTGRPAHVLLDVRCSDIKRRGRTVSAYSAQIESRRDGRVIGSGAVTMACMAPAVYSRVRGDKAQSSPQRALPEAVTPELVGRRRTSDVVICATGVERVWTLRTDQNHPVLFDHPVDHVPGMVLMEAARQAALAVLQEPEGLAVACDATFDQYVEFDSACLVTANTEPAEMAGPRTVSVRFDQGGATVATCRVKVLAI
ncbi:ScbA/BarX family gamma-butyrolactone biosynthesis protein [Streptomyces albidochromogenes]|uniref:ScbA/BarX family gamma-butyrolactone biosynthesis protein n=1 Tax=Streptomyces albidochromogenes TaxID=329524 RepID=A0ABW6FWL9_9ACTN